MRQPTALFTSMRPSPRLRGVTLIEIAVVLVVIGVLFGVGVTVYRMVQTGARATATTALLRGVAGAQEANYRSRGAFVAATSSTDTAGIARLSLLTNVTKDATASGWTGPSDEAGLWTGGSPGKVSVAVTGTGTSAAAGLAARDSSGVCRYRIVYAPASGRNGYENTLASGTCSGAAALADAASTNP